ncbi:MAG: beta strand repeat-containing protein [Steroidobacteraceae bacterium]
MSKFASIMAVAVATLALAGCGGGTGPLTGSASSGSSGPTNTTKYTVSLLSSSPQMPSDGSTPATITALVEDSSNNVVSAVPVTFTASSGAMEVTQGATGDTGTATATLSTGGDSSDRQITVTGVAGATTATVTVSVIGTKLSLSGPTSLIIGNAGNYTATLVDSAGKPIANQSVTVKSANGNTISATPVTTNSTGEATFTLTAANSGADTITASADGIEATQAVSVSNEAFAFSSPANGAQIAIGTSKTVSVTWVNSGTPVNSQPVTFATTRGTFASSGTSTATVNTNSSGTATVTVSSTNAGPATISASGSSVSTQISVDFIATTPASINVQASPTSVATQGPSSITATVRDANNNLVPNQTVDFTLSDLTGGALSAATAITNAEGQATVVYTAGSTTSATNGVTVTATVQGTSVTSSTTLTVSGQTAFLSLGTGNLISAYSNTQYLLPYSVQAVDSSGHGISGVIVSFTVTSLGYLKGARVYSTPPGTWETISSTDSGDADVYVLDGIDGCLSEDTNDNGILDTNPHEDYNGNGKLDPGLVASTDVSSATTNSAGSASLNLIYPKDHAYYVAVMLTATATVSGTQSSTSVQFWLPGEATDFSDSKTAPPGPVSPYGIGITCIDPN